MILLHLAELFRLLTAAGWQQETPLSLHVSSATKYNSSLFIAPCSFHQLCQYESDKEHKVLYMYDWQSPDLTSASLPACQPPSPVLAMCMPYGPRLLPISTLLSVHMSPGSYCNVYVSYIFVHISPASTSHSTNFLTVLS